MERTEYRRARLGLGLALTLRLAKHSETFRAGSRIYASAVRAFVLLAGIASTKSALYVIFQVSIT